MCFKQNMYSQIIKLYYLKAALDFILILLECSCTPLLQDFVYELFPSICKLASRIQDKELHMVQYISLNYFGLQWPFNAFLLYAGNTEMYEAFHY
jgi:hypothetical protein